ncbi:MAG: EAL domain-containing protein [Gammaproteobacteria bacterium]|nr:EAL domain-containing protein [Gammaproteobacteria bacterium]
MKLKKTKSIRSRLLIPFIISLVLILLSIQFLLYSYQREEQKEFTRNLDIKISKSFQQALLRDTEQINGFISFINNSSTLQQVWQSKDRADLLDSSLPVFQQLQKHHRITHFYYHNLDGTNFLRVHAPEKHSDKIDRATLKKAMSTKETTAGIEFGVLGQFVLRIVTPWEIDGKLTGYIELGEEINHILDTISTLHDHKLILSISKDYIYKNKLKETENFLNAKKTWDKYKNIVVIDQTIKTLSAELIEFIDGKTNRNFTIFKINNTSHLASNINIQDFSGNDVGTLTYVHNIDEHLAHNNSLLWGVLSINISISLVLFTFYYLYSGRLGNILEANYNNLKKEIVERKAAETELLNNKQQLEVIVEERNKSLDESKKRYRTLFDKTADALLLIEGDKFIDCNQAALDMLGYNSKKELLDTHPSILSPEFQPDGQSSKTKANQMIEAAYKKGSHRFEWNHVRKNGEVFPVEVLLTSIPYGASQLLHVVWRDISDRKQAEQEIRYRAYYDSLTKLPNRQLLLDRLKQAIVTSRRRQDYNALLFLDLDRFKTINDSLGHSVGDLLLIETANRILSCIREEDTAARFGGDEYVIMLKHLGNEQEHASLHAKRIAEKIQKSFRRAFQLKDHELHITSSIGISIFPIENESMEDVIKHADTAMYSAKESGRNKIAFYLSEMHDTVLKRLTLEKDLRQTVKNKQLEVYYQPQINNDRKVIGVEALIRWQHPELGFINPEEFISIAEDTGIIFDIGNFVLRQAVTDMLSLQADHCMPDHISINISPHQFRHPDFVGQIKKIIQQFHLEHHVLTLEVTEGVIIDNLSETIDKFEQLRGLGARLSLDDFGTGYSSLSYLKRLPLDELKIDKSFVFDVMKDPHDAQLVETIINIAHQFGLDTVAEGVENEEQLQFLKHKSCKIYQGYYYSRPLPLEQLKAFLLKN